MFLKAVSANTPAGVTGKTRGTVTMEKIFSLVAALMLSSVVVSIAAV
jgi:hypothetical protein